MPSEGERIATVEEQVRGLRGDVQELTAEQARTRERLHKLEGTTAGMVKEAAVRAQVAADAAQKTQRWIQVLTAIVALAGIIGPFIYTGAGH